MILIQSVMFDVCVIRDMKSYPIKPFSYRKQKLKVLKNAFRPHANRRTFAFETEHYRQCSVFTLLSDLIRSFYFIEKKKNNKKKEKRIVIGNTIIMAAIESSF